ncbi:hypothetical protein M0R72_06115 [Candidatus Pacearchaeota archaeon]|jgi:hypothetical protein|nr:hypothetical protein [Candidatus Pacearchaeota archaeon]
MASSATKVILLAAAGVGGYLLYSSYKAKNASPYPEGLLPWVNEGLFPEGTYANMGEVPPGTAPIYPVDLSQIDPTGNVPFKAYAYYPAGTPIAVTHEQVMANPNVAVNGRIEVAPGVTVSPLDIYYNTDVTWGTPVEGAVASGDWCSCASIPFLDALPMLLPTGHTPMGVSDALGRNIDYQTAALNYVNGVYGPVNPDGSPATGRSEAWYNQIGADAKNGKPYLDAAIKQAQQTSQQAQQATGSTQQTTAKASAKSNASPTGTAHTASLGNATSLSQVLAQSGIDLSKYHVTTTVDAVAASNDNKVKDSIKKTLLTSSSQSVRDNADSIATAIARNIASRALADQSVSVTMLNPGKVDGDVILRTMSAPETTSTPKNAVLFNNVTALNSAVVVTTNADGKKVALIGSNPSQVAASKVSSSINPLSFVQEKTNTVSAIPMQTTNVQNMFVGAPSWMAQAAQKVAATITPAASSVAKSSGSNVTKASNSSSGTGVQQSAPQVQTSRPAIVTTASTPQVSAAAPSWFSSAMASAAASGKIGKY